MSISSAISNAVSGLTAASRGTEVVSANIANALTPGYARRELNLSTRSPQMGGGVHIYGVSRLINKGLLADNRLAKASLGASETTAAFHAAMEKTFGAGTERTSLVQALTDFETALTSAASRPDSEARLSGVVDAAGALVKKINDISASIQKERAKADKTISQDVTRVNDALEQVAKLNSQIVVLAAQGKDTASLVDARQAAIDEISGILPLREVPRENGQVSLFTPGGMALLDGTKPVRIGFSAAPGISAGMSVENGDLSALTFDGTPLTAAQQAMLGKGSLSANFAIRDQIAPAFQQQIDAFAREIYARFSDPALDSSLTENDPGLFTDAQHALDPDNEPGFASRIALNSLVVPDQGGQLWRLRAGINADGPGDAGESELLSRLAKAITDTQSPASSNLSDTQRSLQTLSAELSSKAATSRLTSEATALQDRSRQSGLKEALLADGVDSDKEMESLLALERAYSANTKVFQTANDMLDAILRLT